MSTTDVPGLLALLSGLTDHHHRLLVEGSGIDPDVVRERGYRSCSRPASGLEDAVKLRLKAMGIGTSKLAPKHLSGIVIPVYRATGERIGVEYRPDEPVRDYKNGKRKDQKYLRPYGRPANLDVHPRNKDKILDPSQTLWITEGIKKADCLTSREICAVAVPGVWNWRHQNSTLGDWEDIILKGRTVVICFDSDTSEKKSVKDAMVRLGRWLRSKGVKKVLYLITPGEVDGSPVKGVDDYFVAGGTMGALVEAATEKAPKDATDDRFTDVYMADLAADEAFDGRFAYSSGLGWLRWNGVVWKRCEEGDAREQFRLYVIEQLEAAIRAMKDGGDRTELDGWRKLTGAGRLTSITSLARHNAAVAVDAGTELDQDTDLLNCPNGIVDLRTGELLPHDPAKLMTKLAGVEYRPGCTHPMWEKALQALPEKVRRWYQLRMGQALTGDMTPDDLLIINHGGGRNGKSTVLSATAAAAGGYYGLLSDRILMANPDAHPTELMDLRGLRYAALEETAEARHLDTQRLKKTIGTKQVTARHIRKDDVTFTATHTLVVNTNHKPVITETDHATWERLALVTWPYTYRKTAAEIQGPNDRLGDPLLRVACETDHDVHAAVLAWMVQGAVAYYADEGAEFRRVPSRVAGDTLEWRKEADLGLGFITEHLRFNPDSHIRSDDLRIAVCRWLRDKGMRDWNDKTVADRIGGHDEFTQHHVVKKQTKRSPKLSRPAKAMDAFSDAGGTLTYAPDTAAYRAWHGVEFLPDGTDDAYDLSV